ncbi:hypothetical protein Bacsa_3677 (plasmid) [Phocaeicola salanitronis DSM 18170]|uniref:Uncharacterized protein n=1 Tax=Phocaeicola salanitronis (strain DSM 18170 / JCM 13657 / CCUG 60908 / BL78) TaxID=667015 RepID=F0R977_PHOSB|nr:hypothetical protein Bacsa_3677 [Phocaeicola salanitronis DSM 18170]
MVIPYLNWFRNRSATCSLIFDTIFRIELQKPELILIPPSKRVVYL